MSFIFREFRRIGNPIGARFAARRLRRGPWRPRFAGGRGHLGHCSRAGKVAFAPISHFAGQHARNAVPLEPLDTAFDAVGLGAAFANLGEKGAKLALKRFVPQAQAG